MSDLIDDDGKATMLGLLTLALEMAGGDGAEYVARKMLAEHDRQVKAEALREAADELCVVPDYTATQVAAELYERAEQIEKGSTDEG